MTGDATSAYSFKLDRSLQAASLIAACSRRSFRMPEELVEVARLQGGTCYTRSSREPVVLTKVGTSVNGTRYGS
jgi:hypothetical protein